MFFFDTLTGTFTLSSDTYDSVTKTYDMTEGRTDLSHSYRYFDYSYAYNQGYDEGMGYGAPTIFYKNKGSSSSTFSLDITGLNGDGQLDFYTTSYDHDDGSSFTLSIPSGTVTLNPTKVSVRGGMCTNTKVAFTGASDATVRLKYGSYTGRAGAVCIVTKS